MCLHVCPHPTTLQVTERFILWKNKFTSLLQNHKGPQRTRSFEATLKCGRQRAELPKEITEQHTKKGAAKHENGSGCFEPKNRMTQEFGSHSCWLVEALHLGQLYRLTPVSGVPKIIPRFDDSLEGPIRLKNIIVLMAKIYCREKIRSNVSKGKRCVDRVWRKSGGSL